MCFNFYPIIVFFYTCISISYLCILALYMLNYYKQKMKTKNPYTTAYIPTSLLDNLDGHVQHTLCVFAGYHFCIAVRLANEEMKQPI